MPSRPCPTCDAGRHIDCGSFLRRRVVKQHSNGNTCIATLVVGSLNCVAIVRRFASMTERKLFLRQRKRRLDRSVIRAERDETVLDGTLELWEVVLAGSAGYGVGAGAHIQTGGHQWKREGVSV